MRHWINERIFSVKQMTRERSLFFTHTNEDEDEVCVIMKDTKKYIFLEAAFKIHLVQRSCSPFCPAPMYV